jgi:hypothetical protein
MSSESSAPATPFTAQSRFSAVRARPLVSGAAPCPAPRQSSGGDQGPKAKPRQTVGSVSRTWAGAGRAMATPRARVVAARRRVGECSRDGMGVLPRMAGPDPVGIGASGRSPPVDVALPT